MSRSTLTAIAGAAIGFFIPGGSLLTAQIGWALGSFLGAEGPADQTAEGPRLNDLQAESIEYGSDIPRGYGRWRQAGFRMWQRDIREQKTVTEQESGGKGGGGATTTTVTYTYYGTFAIALCEGPIAGIRKIWADSNLIYNLGDTSDLETIIASNRAAQGIRIYLGTDDQLPDSLIQATEGAANTPAYRNTAYIVFDDLPLEKYGNRIPNITAEVIGAGSFAMKGLELSTTVTFPEIGAGGRLRARSIYGFDGAIARIHLTASDATVTDSSEIDLETPESILRIDYRGNILDQSQPVELGGGSGDVSTQTTQSTDTVRWINSYGVERCAIIDGDWVWINGRNQIGMTSNAGDLIGWGTVLDVRGVRNTRFSRQNLEQALIDYGATGEWLIAAVGAMEPWTKDRDFLYVFTAPSDPSTVFNADKYYKFELISGALEITEDGTVSGMAHNTIDGALGISCDASGDSGLFAESEEYIWSGVLATGNNPSIYLGEKTGTNFSFSLVYNETGTRVYQFASIVASNTVAILYCQPQDDNAEIYVFSRQMLLSASGPTLSSIVSDICTRAGLESSEIDVTELTDTVDGYIISRNMSARAAIEPLQKAYLFDGAEIGGKIKFIKRGKSSVVTIPQDDLGAGELGSSTPQLTTTRQQDSELPSEVNVSYISSTRDYETASQPSQRINKNVENVVTQELPIVLSDNRGAQLADITLYNAWTEREKFNFNLTMEYIDRDPTDVVTVQYGSQSRVVRLTKISYGDWLECEAVSEDATIYSSGATAEEDDYTDQVVGLAGPTRVEYLDIPLLRNQDNGAGLYYAVCGLFSSWTGATIFKSLDDGITYNSVTSFFNAATIGSTTTVLASADPELWDRTSTLTVRLVNGTLSSTTGDGAIQGSNYLLVGSEIINFVNATLNADDTYTLDTFIRGRRGTEWAVGSHSTGEDVVLLNENTIDRFEAIIGTARTYKAVTIGTFIDEADEESINNTGVNLKPFGPVLISGTRDGSGNLTGDFTRRSRYITAPLWTPPLFEDSESYEVDIMDGATVVRTISTSTTDFSYTAAQQTTDFGSPQASIEVNIYQLSGTVGRGYAGNATI